MIVWKDYAEFLAIVEKAALAVKDANRRRSTRIDYIMCQGMSGVLVGAAVAAMSKTPLLVLRKAGDEHGATMVMPGCLVTATSKILFIDDHISGARTFTRCLGALPRTTTISYTYEYNPTCSSRQPGKIVAASAHPLANVQRALVTHAAP